jgi:hypothetical protein
MRSSFAHSQTNEFQATGTDMDVRDPAEPSSPRAREIRAKYAFHRPSSVEEEEEQEEVR